MSIDDDYEIIRNSNKFDVDYYRKTYNVDENIDPIYHYLIFGCDKNYNPSREFNTRIYLEKNPDVKNAKINPFVHFIKWGEFEGRICRPLEFIDVKINNIYNKQDLVGENGYNFPIDSYLELLQHYDSDYQPNFKKDSFSKNILFKRRLFEKYDISYDFFVIPDKSVVCRRLLPFKHDNPIRLIDDFEFFDFSKFLNENHYSKLDNSLNLKGGELFFLRMVSLIDKNFDCEKMESLLSYSKLEKEGSNFVKKPMALKEKVFLQSNEEFDVKPLYLHNDESYSDSRVLIFYNSDIGMIKYLLSYYFREVFLFYDYGALNRDAIKWFAPDIILEIRNERFIPFYNDASWINDSTDFLKNVTFNNPQVDFIENTEENNDKISVIIPIYNVEKYLEQCITSVINQSYKNTEIICVNDGSTDNTLEVMKKCAEMDDRIIIIDTPNGGPGAARNYGLKQAKGDYIFFLDSDDWLKEDALESLYDKMKNTDLDMVFYQLINYMEETGSLFEDPLNNHVCFQYDNLDERDFFNYVDVKDHFFEIPVCTCAKLYSRKFFEENELTFSEGVYYEDNEFFYNAFFKSKKCGFLKKHLLYRRVRPDSITGKFHEKQTDVTAGLNNTILTFIKNDTYELFKSELINHTFMNIVHIFNNAPLYFKQIFYEKIKNEFIGFHELKDDFENYLTEDKKIIYDLFVKHDFYIPFDSEYKVYFHDYDIFDGNNLYNKNSEEYSKFKNETEQYKIGVVIPIYNNGLLTHRTMMSIENQSFPFEDIEILLINDNSNDETFELINEYAKKYSNVKAIHTKSSSGSCGTPRNIGIKECSSEYLMFLDHDDFFELDALEKLYNEITSTKSDVVFGTYSEIRNKELIKILAPYEKHGYFKDLSDNERLIAFPAPSIWAKLFKTSFIKDNEILFPTILGEDAIFMMDVFIRANGIVYLWEDNICFHDLRTTSTTNNVSLRYMQELFVSELYMYERFDLLNKPEFTTCRGLGIIDFSLDQLFNSNLNNEDLDILFNLMKNFLTVHNNLGSKPHNIRNMVLFDIILNGDKELFNKIYYNRSLVKF